MTALAPTVEAFFTQRLAVQRDASPHTVAAYRDTLRLLLVFAHNRTGTPPSRLDVGDLDAELIAAFLTHLETDRSNSVSTRNARLTAIHSLFRYAALQHPEHGRIDPAGAGHPRQTPPAETGVLPDPRRDRRPAVCARQRHLVRSP
jgi:site-specific recombinase XerD